MDHSEYREDLQLEDYPHSYDHSDPKASILFIFGGATVVLLILVSAGIMFYYDTTLSEQVFTKVLTVDSDQLKKLRATEDHELYTYGYADRAAGKVRLPINRAMELISTEAAENRIKYPTNSYAIKTPEQLAAAGSPAVSQPGAAAAGSSLQQGAGSNPNVQPSSTAK